MAMECSYMGWMGKKHRRMVEGCIAPWGGLRYKESQKPRMQHKKERDKEAHETF